MFNRLRALFSRPQAAAPAPQAKPAPDDVKVVTVYDTYGRELKITRKDWREKVLLPNLESHWNNPDQLYSMIVTALNDGLCEDMLDASSRLLEIDPLLERGHTLRGIVLLENGLLDEAELAFKAGIAKVGETAALLTNLAKVEAARNNQKQADTLLWKAVATDPNFDSALGWWLALANERGGLGAYVRALHEAAALPNSWRAKVWLARHHFEHGEKAAALGCYEDVLASYQVDSEALLTISGDLGNHGQVPLIASLIAPLYDPQQHDPRVGLNLLQAYLQLGRCQEGEALLHRLYALNLTPYKEHLDHFAAGFERFRAESETGRAVDQEQLQIEHIAITRPIWHYGLDEIAGLFTRKPEQAPVVACLALSKAESSAVRAESQREDEVGRLTRAIPLYLAEAVHYWTAFAAHTYVAVVKGGGPVVYGGETDGEAVCDQLPEQVDFVVAGHLRDDGDKWGITLQLWDRRQRRCLVTESIQAPKTELGAAVLLLEQKVLAGLGRQHEQPCDGFYVRPAAEVMDPYLTELGQSFMLTLLAEGMVGLERVWGERNMLEWPLRMALHWPGVDTLKLMYFSGLSKAAAYQSTVLGEFKERTLALLSDAEQQSNVMLRLKPLAHKLFGLEE